MIREWHLLDRKRSFPNIDIPGAPVRVRGIPVIAVQLPHAGRGSGLWCPVRETDRYGNIVAFATVNDRKVEHVTILAQGRNSIHSGELRVERNCRAAGLGSQDLVADVIVV